MTSRSSLLLCAVRPCMQLNCWDFVWCIEAPELLMNWPESSVPDTAWTSRAFSRGPQSLEESTTMGSVLGSISASIMEIFRMSDTEGLSPEDPELDSGISLAVASPLLKTGDEWRELPKVILVTVALWVMIGCCGEDIWWGTNTCKKQIIKELQLSSFFSQKHFRKHYSTLNIKQLLLWSLSREFVRAMMIVHVTASLSLSTKDGAGLQSDFSAVVFRQRWVTSVLK